MKTRKARIKSKSRCHYCRLIQKVSGRDSPATMRQRESENSLFLKSVMKWFLVTLIMTQHIQSFLAVFTVPKKNPPYPLTADNFIMAIVTKSELKIEFDDDKKVITIITPGENKIVISDEDKSILITDQSDNKFELSDSGIVMDSPKDISFSAKGKISLDAMGEISISSKADLKAAGMNIEHNANVGLTSKGGASAELSAGGNTTVKGAMVMIN